jgi:RimJ/RimL family protein N-acetyltransferase
LRGRYTTLEAFDPTTHGDALWACVGGLENASLWDYMAVGPFATRADFDAEMFKTAGQKDPMFLAIVDHATSKAVGRAAYMSIVPNHRTMEVGHLLFSPLLQRTRVATEAMYLMMRHAFDDLNYRRYEWKCNALNLASRRAALRLGFTFEGIFRQHMIVKGRNRDTAWFSIVDGEWPAIKSALERWLQPGNFDEGGVQRVGLRVEKQSGG